MTRPRADLDVSSTLLDPAAHPGEDPLSWPDLFGDDRPVVVEIGSGKGLFLANAAAARPDHGFFGIEIAKKYARLAAERIVKAGLTNVRMWPADAGRLMDRRVVPASLREVHVYFPDPWWKKRHKKRRVFNEALVASIARALVPAGELHVATDVEEYFGVIRELVATDPRFAEIPPPPLGDAESDHDYLTNFERKYRIEGRPVYRVSYRMKPALSTERLLPAEPQVVFAAFEKPGRLACWWGPDGFKNTFERFEFEPGGRWTFTMHGPNGVDYPNESTFRTIERDRRVVIEHVSAPRFTLAVTLAPRGDHTLLSWDQVFEDAEVAAKLAPICRPANEQNLDRLQALLAGADEAP